MNEVNNVDKVAVEQSPDVQDAKKLQDSIAKAQAEALAAKQAAGN